MIDQRLYPKISSLLKKVLFALLCTVEPSNLVEVLFAHSFQNLV